MLVSVGLAHAYVGQNPYIVHLDASSRQARCDSQVQITATVRDAETGNLVQQQSVDWDLKVSRSPGDSVFPARTITNEQGQATTTLRFGLAEGERTVRATIREWPATIDVSCQGGVPVATPTPQSTPRPTATATTAPTSTSTARPPESVTPSPPVTATETPGVDPSGTPIGTQVPSQTPTPSPVSSSQPGQSPVASPDVLPTGADGLPVTAAPSSAPSARPASPGSVSTPSTPDMASLAVLALIAAGLAALGFVVVRRR
jgi:hypothetical protein